MKKVLVSSGGLYRSGEMRNDNAAEKARRNAMTTAVMPEPANTARNDWYAEMWCMIAAARFCGHKGSPITENGQSARMPASGSCIMDAKLKNTVARNSTSIDAVTIF